MGTARTIAAWLGAGLLAATTAHAEEAAKGHGLLEAYASSWDPAFRWSLHASADGAAGVTTHALELVSQTWRAPGEVSHPDWTHWLRIAIPDTLEHRTALLVIGGGRRRESPEWISQPYLDQLATLTRSVVVYLPNVPNQPMELVGDGRRRFEDDLLAESWVHAMRTQDPGWIVHMAMVKSAVAAMTAAEEFCASGPGGAIELDGFVLVGGSKRGWTTWLTGAVDPRVRAIMPVVIDTLNMPEVMRHHWGAYGFWAEAIGDYSSRGFGRVLGTPDAEILRRVVDPYLFRDRLTMPKMILNAASDEFFLPDTPRHWLPGLEGPWWLRVVPNAGHGDFGSVDALGTLIGFYWALLNGVEVPALRWRTEAEGPERWLVVESEVRPRVVTAWEAVNPGARDFRKPVVGEAWSPTRLEATAGEDGVYRARFALRAPDRGFRATLIEVMLPLVRPDGESSPVPFILSTEVFVTPDVLPFAGVEAE